MYYFFIDKLQLPLPPERVSTKIKNNNKVVNLINGGEANILKDAGLTEIEFSVVIPSQKYSFANYTDGFIKPKVFLDTFEKLKSNKRSVWLTITRTGIDGSDMFNTSLRCSLESYTIEEDAKQGLDLKVQLRFKQYKEYELNEIEVLDESDSETTVAVNSTRETDNSPAPTEEVTYTVKSGDTLWKIASAFYGSGAKYMTIYNANRSVIGGNPDMIQVGMVLVIPDASQAKAEYVNTKARAKASLEKWKQITFEEEDEGSKS